MFIEGLGYDAETFWVFSHVAICSLFAPTKEKSKEALDESKEQRDNQKQIKKCRNEWKQKEERARVRRAYQVMRDPAEQPLLPRLSCPFLSQHVIDMFRTWYAVTYLTLISFIHSHSILPVINNGFLSCLSCPPEQHSFFLLVRKALQSPDCLSVQGHLKMKVAIM